MSNWIAEEIERRCEGQTPDDQLRTFKELVRERLPTPPSDQEN